MNNKCGYRLRRIGVPATVKDVVDIFVLQNNTTVIGRAKNKVDFFIDSSKNKALISRIHARITKLQMPSGHDVFKIYDVSLNGTYINDVKIASEAILKIRDVVVFGHVQGACLEAGKYYKQLSSEFKFMFESFDNETQNLNDFSTDHGITNIPNLLETPTASSVVGSHTRRELTKVFQNNETHDSEAEYKILQEFASTAALTFAEESESDVDLFSVTQILPVNSQHHKASCETKPEQEKTKTAEKKRKRSKQETNSNKSQHTSNTETCSSLKCKIPMGKIVSWVQCDDCDKWYHIKCCGLSLKLVKAKNSKFHCGCT